MNKNQKRVVCFYRVSTKAQVINDDIPLQRNACLEFINKQQNWVFVGEYIEKGVSGFKIHASDREKLEELKDDALNKKFDIVLVFMFDRLGRIEEETPFVLKWFVDQGIEMWSVNEGQRRFDNHVDNLLNYITFWQAAGESKKTQTRTLEAKAQMIEEGRSLGGSAPYGYKHVSTGQHNQKGREIKKMVIDEDEKKVIQDIFDFMTIKGWGSRRIAKYLNETGVPTKKGGKWADNTVLSIIKNTIYKGYFSYGRRQTNGKIQYNHQYHCKVSQVKYDDLVIISDEQWENAKKIIECRGNNEQKGVPKQTKSPLLFTGFIYCNTCGARMTLKYSYNHYQRKDGTWNRDKKPFYQCYGRDNGIAKCDNKNYASHLLETEVLKQVYNYLDALENLNVEDELLQHQEEHKKQFNKEYKIRTDKIKKIEDNIKLLKNEIINVLSGTSRFSEELLSEQIEINTKQLEKENNELTDLIKRTEETNLQREDMIKFTKTIPTWREILQSEDIETKKMILPHIIKEIRVDQTTVDVTLNINKHELLNLATMLSA